jgi:hypothetical protein
LAAFTLSMQYQQAMVASRLRSPLALPQASMVVERTAVGEASRREGIAKVLLYLYEIAISYYWLIALTQALIKVVLRA